MSGMGLGIRGAEGQAPKRKGWQGAGAVCPGTESPGALPPLLPLQDALARGHQQHD